MDSMSPRFMRLFGRMLQPHGFFLYDARLFRILPEPGLVMVVSADSIEPGNRSIVQYGVSALCHGLNPATLPGGSWQLTGLWPLLEDRIDPDRADENPAYEMQANALVFREVLLNRIAGIQSMQDFQAFRKWNYELFGGIPGTEYWDFDQMWESLQLKQYARAEQCLGRGMEKWRQILSGRPSYAKRADVQAKQREFARWMDLFRANDTAQLDQMLCRRMEASRQVLIDYFKTELIP